MEPQNLQKHKAILTKKEIKGWYPPPNLKLYHKAATVKTAWSLTNTQKKSGTEFESLEINSHVHGQLTYEAGDKRIH